MEEGNFPEFFGKRFFIRFSEERYEKYAFPRIGGIKSGIGVIVTVEDFVIFVRVGVG